MSFEYKNTCPLINDAAKSIKEGLYDKLSESFSSKTATAMSIDIYDWIEEYIEDVRETNSKMREEADNQVCNLEDENERLQAIIKELEQQIIDLS
ncbi:MAG TPA: hypothetical protein DCS19_01575 [Flavobacterium sp.]|nr:hypothetical protein [Flavobacterium sp.]